jgi:hypothetical protein
MVAPDAEAAEFTSAIGGTAEIDQAPVLVASAGYDPFRTWAASFAATHVLTCYTYCTILALG